MPTYRIRNKKTQETFDELMTYSELQEKLKNDPDLVHVLSTPSFVTQTGGTLSRTDDGWKDVLKKVKSGSGRGNNIKV